MANEAVNLELPRIIKRSTVYDTSAIPLGTLLVFSGPLQVSSSAGVVDAYAGIATEEKTASDGITSIAYAKDGVWDLYYGGGDTVAVGTLVKISGPNTIDGTVLEADIIAGKVVGKAEEAGAIGTPAMIRVAVGVTV